MASAAHVLYPSAAPAVGVPEPQTRGYQLHLTPGQTPERLAQELEHVAQAGFNLVLFPIYVQGWTFYPSDTLLECRLPRIHPQFRRWNPLALATQLGRELNLSVWGQARPYQLAAEGSRRGLHRTLRWRMGRHPQHLDLARHGREAWHPCPLQRGRLGQMTYRHMLGDLLVEAVSGYPLDGLVLDCTGFGLRGGGLAEHPFCFCESCKARYFEAHQRSLIDDARQGRLAEVRAWQRQEAHEHFSYLRNRLLRTRRTLRIVCQAAPHWRRAANYDCTTDGGPLIDWPGLLGRGELDELLVDHDGEFPGEAFSSRMACDFAHLGDQALFLPLIAARHPGELRLPARVLARYTIPGFITEFPAPLTEAFAIELASTIFAEAAPLPETEPVRAAAFLLQRVRQNHENQPKLHDLMTDLLRLLANQVQQPNDFKLLSVIEQNLQGLEQFIRRGRLRTERVPEPTLRQLGLARRLVRMALRDVRS